MAFTIRRNASSFRRMGIGDGRTWKRRTWPKATLTRPSTWWGRRCRRGHPLLRPTPFLHRRGGRERRSRPRGGGRRRRGLPKRRHHHHRIWLSVFPFWFCYSAFLIGVRVPLYVGPRGCALSLLHSNDILVFPPRRNVRGGESGGGERRADDRGGRPCRWIRFVAWRWGSVWGEDGARRWFQNPLSRLACHGFGRHGGTKGRRTAPHPLRTVLPLCRGFLLVRWHFGPRPPLPSLPPLGVVE